MYTDNYQPIGDISYQPEDQVDLLVFDFHRDFTNIVEQLISEIEMRLEKNGFEIIQPHNDWEDFLEFERFVLSQSKHPRLPPDERRANNQIGKKDLELKLSQTPQTEENVDSILFNLDLMKKFYKDYNPKTAKMVYSKIPIAWKNRQSEGGRWGPGFISELCNLNTTTVSRYLRAFYSAGLREIDFDGEKITIPYNPRSRP